MRGARERLKLLAMDRFEWPMILISLLLTGVGMALIFSATAALGPAGRTFVVKQLTWCSLGVVLLACVLLVDYRLLERWAIWLYAGIVATLLVAWALGKVAGGSQRWIEIGFMRFQPSEFAKLGVVLVLAKYYNTRSERVGSEVEKLLIPLGLTAGPVFLTAIQPDLGTAGVIALVAVSMMVFAGISRKALLWIAGVIAAALPVVLVVGDRLLLDYQKKRLLTFLDPWNDPLGAGYHILQSQIAIGSGGAFGKGFLEGTQNQLMFLPVKHTDFIFSVLAEEWGFAGSLAILVLFGALFMRGLSITAHARDTFGVLAAFGCTALFFWHVTINVGMVTGLVPVVGVPLNFMSYGGSSLLMSFMAVAVLANVSMRRFSY
ncbi:MAG: rod shape-determining protein RodA [Desulfomonile sp.]|nr:rod shape-determining protein RodA [Desulfomonile sp.]